MSHQGLLFNCFCSGREEPLGRAPAAPAATGKPAHGSKRKREGALLGSAMPARGGLGSWGYSSTPALGPRPGSGRGGSRDASPGWSTSKRSCSKNLTLAWICSVPRERAGDGDAATRRWWASGHRRPTTKEAGYGEQGKRREQEEQLSVPGEAQPRRAARRGGGARSRADAARLDRELPPPGWGQAVTEGGDALGWVQGGSRAVAPSPRSPAAVTRCPAPAHPGLSPPRPSTY